MKKYANPFCCEVISSTWTISLIAHVISVYMHSSSCVTLRFPHSFISIFVLARCYNMGLGRTVRF